MIKNTRHKTWCIAIFIAAILGFSVIRAGVPGKSAENKITASLRTSIGTNSPPVATITLPLPGTTYNAGDEIFYAGTGFDPESGTLPPSAFTWQVDLHRDSLTTIPLVPPTSGSTGGSFVIPTTGETSDSVWYRITLTVTNPVELTNTTTFDIFPNTSTNTLTTAPAGLQVLLDGEPHTTPFSFTGVVGIERNISVTSPIGLSGQIYQFVSWSDGRNINHTISTPSVNTTYTAVFEPIPAVPLLNVPVNNAVSQPLSLTLTWHPANGATKYNFQLSADSTFSTTIVDDTTITDTTRTVTGLANSTHYFWHVRAMRPGGTSVFSSLSKFTTLPSPLTIFSTSPLPAATAGNIYNDTLIANGGIPPYTWLLFSGSLPASITLSSSGIVTGTPSVAGSFSFSAQVTDAASSAVTKAFSLTVNAGIATQLVFIQQPTDDTVGVTISPSITVQTKDNGGNNVSSSGITISLTLSGGTGILNGTLTRTTDATGLATFNDVSITAAGIKTLTASGGGLSPAISNSFTIFNRLPSLSTISPVSKTAGDPGFTLTVNGANFVQGSIVRFNGADRTTSFVNSSQLTATIPANNITTAGTFSITVFNAAPGGGTSGSRTLSVLSPVVNIKAMLQGPFSSGSMTTTLRNSGYLPLNQPYNTSPWNYTGTEFVSSVPSNVVDWVLIELRTGTSGATKVAARAAFIKNNGAVVDIDGTSPVTFSGIVGGNYYIVVKQRNHLAVMSASLVLLNSTSALYDFTTGTSKYFGSDAKNLGSGIFGLYAGDYSHDGFIDSDDFIGPDNEVFHNGYRRSDLNMDGFVDSGDFIDPDNNVFKSTHVPN